MFSVHRLLHFNIFNTQVNLHVVFCLGSCIDIVSVSFLPAAVRKIFSLFLYVLTVSEWLS